MRLRRSQKGAVVGDDDDMAGAIAGVLIAVVLGYLLFRLEWRLMRPITPGGAVRRLRRSKTHRFSAEIRGIGWAWDPNPAIPRGSGFNRAYGRGRVTYEMGSDSVIHLTVVRPDGSSHESEGPLPLRYVRGTPEAARARRLRRYMWAALTVYPLCGAIGFVIGYNAGTGLTRATMFGHGLMGFFAGYLGVAVLMHFVVVILGATGMAGRIDKRRSAARRDSVSGG